MRILLSVISSMGTAFHRPPSCRDLTGWIDGHDFQKTLSPVFEFLTS